MFSKKSIITIFILMFILCNFANAQNTNDSSRKVNSSPDKPTWVVLSLNAGYFINFSDMGNRYPAYTCFPLGVEYQHKNKWIASLDYNLIFGTSVDIAGYFDHISNDNGYMIDAKGQQAIVNTYMRGFSARAHFGKIIPLSKNPAWRDWSILASGGLGYTQTYIQFQFDEGELPQLEGTYTGGYDRLSGGFQIAERIKLQYLNPNSLSFVVGIDLIQGVSKSLRPWNFSTNSADNQGQKEIATGFSLGLLIPIKTRSKNAVPDYFLE